MVSCCTHVHTNVHITGIYRHPSAQAETIHTVEFRSEPMDFPIIRLHLVLIDVSCTYVISKSLTHLHLLSHEHSSKRLWKTAKQHLYPVFHVLCRFGHVPMKYTCTKLSCKWTREDTNPKEGCQCKHVFPPALNVTSHYIQQQTPWVN